MDELGSLGELPPEAPLPTINFSDFVNILYPQEVGKCISCNTSLLNTAPPHFLPGAKTALLTAISDILNLPVHDLEREEEAKLDFPFCQHCTAHRVTKLTQVYDKLLLLQQHFSSLREDLIKDILRVFLGNMVHENKVPLHVIREARAHERMFTLFKKHSERKVRNAVEKGVQTEVSAQFVPPSAMPLVSNVVEISSTNSNKRRRNAPRKSESHHQQASNRVVNRRGSWNHLPPPLPPPQRHYQQPEQYQQYSHSHNMPSTYTPHMPVSYGDSNSCTLNSLGSSGYSYPEVGTHGSMQYPERLPLEGPSSSFENAMNGAMSLMLDENGLLELEDGYLPGVDFPHSFDPKDNLGVNGLPHLDQSTLSDDFQSVLGLMEGIDANDGSFSLEVESELVVGRKSSPFKYPVAEESQYEEETVIMNLDSGTTVGARPSCRKQKTRCEICDKMIVRDYLKQHMETIHSGERIHKCRGCDKRFARKDHHVGHEERHIINSKRIYFCHRCGKEDDSSKISGKSSYIGHCVKTHGIEDDVVEFFHFCDADDCLQSFKIRDDYLEHLETHWNDKAALKCSICEKPFAVMKRLEIHEKEAHKSNEPYFVCQFCHMGFDEESDFSQHILFHKVKMPEDLSHVCETCGKGFEMYSRLRTHRYREHGKNKVKVINNFDTPSPSPSSSQSNQIASPSTSETMNKPFCDICKKAFKRKESLTRHMKTHERDTDETKAKKGRKSKSKAKEADVDNDSGKHECEYCKKKFKTSQEFRRHLVTRHKDEHLANGRQFCVVCYKAFPGKEQLDEHCDQKHKKFKCQICGLVNPNSLLMNQHMKRHNGSFPATCKICKQGFKGEPALKMHLKKMHSKTKMSSSSESNSELDDEDDEDLEELRNTLTPINDEAVNELLNSHDDMLDLFQL